ncbi:MAG: hypothetical protein M1813_002740 [Trichoglossum hirsutum]|nr:MAG: hypothetical protein M1813_002740 [Trichoglossum hirsutum]
MKIQSRPIPRRVLAQQKRPSWLLVHVVFATVEVDGVVAIVEVDSVVAMVEAGGVVALVELDSVVAMVETDGVVAIVEADDVVAMMERATMMTDLVSMLTIGILISVLRLRDRSWLLPVALD